MSEAQAPEDTASPVEPASPADLKKSPFLHIRVEPALRQALEERAQELLTRGMPQQLANLSVVARSILLQAVAGPPAVDRLSIDAGLEALVVALQRAMRKLSLVIPEMVEEELRLLAAEARAAEAAGVNRSTLAVAPPGGDSFPVGTVRQRYPKTGS